MAEDPPKDDLGGKGLPELRKIAVERYGFTPEDIATKNTKRKLLVAIRQRIKDTVPPEQKQINGVMVQRLIGPNGEIGTDHRPVGDVLPTEIVSILGMALSKAKENVGLD